VIAAQKRNEGNRQGFGSPLVSRETQLENPIQFTNAI
jgi:hypothetical protein